MSDILYSVVSPLGKQNVKKIHVAPAINTLENKRIGMFWAAFANGDILLEAVNKRLHERFPNIETVFLNPGRTRKPSEYADPTIGEIGIEAKIDAAIATVGG